VRWSLARPGVPPWGSPHRPAKAGIYRRLLAAERLFRGRLLDLGCGAKPYRPTFAHRTTAWWGCDMVAAAGRQPAVDVIADACALPFRERSFDTVLCTELAEHVPDPERLFSEIARVLAPAGCLILSTPFLFGLHEEPRDFYRYTPYALERLARQHGLAVQSCEPTGGFFGVLAQIVGYHVPEPGTREGRLLARACRAALQLPLLGLDRAVPRPRDALGYVLVAQRRP
jgi:SAM-dependent methyltransferase